MTIEKLDGTSPRLYTLVAPLVMRRSVLRQNNNYPFWTSRSHTWFVAWEGENVYGFVPVEITDSGIARINNYYVSGDDRSCSRGSCGRSSGIMAATIRYVPSR